jgi:carbamate kinase
MRVVVALGGNALLSGEPMTADLRRARTRAAAQALAAVAHRHQLVLSHGDGPQLGLLALQAAACEDVEVPPLDVLDAHAEGVTGYVLEHELRNALPPDVAVATVLTSVEVDPLDPAFAQPSRFVGPLYDRAQGDALTEQHQWVFRPDGRFLRRVVPSPEPMRILEIEPVNWLLDRGTVVICAGGAGVPAARTTSSGCVLERVDAVIDADLVSELIARGVDADLLVMATDVDAVYADWGLRTQRRLRRVTPEALRSMDLASGSMGAKGEAAARFVEATGRRAAIGSLADVVALVAGTGGTVVVGAG